MPKFAANLTMLFTEVPFLDRFDLAAQAGFRAVEFLFPYAFDAQQIRSRLVANGLRLVLHNQPRRRLGRWRARRGLVIWTSVAEFRAGVARAIAYAQALGVEQLNVLAGKAPAGVADGMLRDTFVGNLRFAAAALKDEGLRLLIEPINTFDIPGFWLNRTQQALAILDEVGADNAFLQYDIYHAQRSEGGAGRDAREAHLACASATSRWPTTRAATSPAPARSTTTSCSRTSTASATTAGSAANTSPRRPPPPASAG